MKECKAVTAVKVKLVVIFGEREETDWDSAPGGASGAVGKVLLISL